MEAVFTKLVANDPNLTEVTINLSVFNDDKDLVVLCEAAKENYIDSPDLKIDLG
jgi:hypothetical protein